MTKNTLEKSYRQKINKLPDANLIEVKPGNYMMFSKNKMKRIVENAQGLVLGQRVKDDNVKIVLVDEDLILIPTDAP